MSLEGLANREDLVLGMEDDQEQIVNSVVAAMALVGRIPIGRQQSWESCVFQ